MPDNPKGTTQNFLDGPKQRGSFLLGGRTAQTTAALQVRRRRRIITARQHQTVQTSTPNINTHTNTITNSNASRHAPVAPCQRRRVCCRRLLFTTSIVVA